jgi:hypothetical protein
MGIEGWKEILEFATGNPVLVGYLAYIVGLLIAIAVVKATEAGEPAQAANADAAIKEQCAQNESPV